MGVGRSPRWKQLPAVITAFALLWAAPAIAASAGDYFVHSLPGAPPGPLLKMHAGYATILFPVAPLAPLRDC